jgi:hypothetical protein
MPSASTAATKIESSVPSDTTARKTRKPKTAITDSVRHVTITSTRCGGGWFTRLPRAARR